MKKILSLLIFIFLFSIEIRAGIPKLNFLITGDMFYNFLADNNINDTNRFEIENVKADIRGGIKFFNRKNIAGLFLLRINSDDSIYNMGVDRFFINYFTPVFNMKFFYGDEIENFNDGFRLLDEETENYYQPIIFYNDSKLKKIGYWGRYFTGIKFTINKFVKEELILAKKIGNDEDNKFSVISRSVKNFNLSDDIKIFSGLNFIYIKQDYTLPAVNSSSWAEYNGVWYEFNTNSFYDIDNDYKIKATGEAGLKLLDMLDVWGEAGIDNKYGGYYGETTQKATSSGNVSYVMKLNSTGYKKLIFGGGIKFNLNFFVVDVSYIGKSSEKEIFSTVSNNLVLKTNKFNVSSINAKIRFDFSFLESSIGVQIDSSDTTNTSVYFDEYNFLNNFSIPAEKIIRLRSFNKINAGIVKFFPEIEFTKYDDNTTMEINGGVLVKIFKELNFYGNIRYKSYNINNIRKNFINPFLSVRYIYRKNIYFDFGYGLDNRLLYRNDYGFEYYLNNYISSRGEYGFDEIFDAEDKISKNNYIFITGSIGF